MRAVDQGNLTLLGSSRISFHHRRLGTVLGKLFRFSLSPCGCLAAASVSDQEDLRVRLCLANHSVTANAWHHGADTTISFAYAITPTKYKDQKLCECFNSKKTYYSKRHIARNSEKKEEKEEEKKEEEEEKQRPWRPARPPAAPEPALRAAPPPPSWNPGSEASTTPPQDHSMWKLAAPQTTTCQSALQRAYLKTLDICQVGRQSCPREKDNSRGPAMRFRSFQLIVIEDPSIWAAALVES
ncbi:hypothetical protein H920_08746 [Fukomys damarensis]|uniref:Uncharacterized protein n=1 Tax=Fukomys damarensis TaxID=885580 RepID=A0A091DCH2_FUKDA|nr:hypothetical protein H920_08746 [Fukomys damarensis]